MIKLSKSLGVSVIFLLLTSIMVGCTDSSSATIPTSTLKTTQTTPQVTEQVTPTTNQSPTPTTTTTPTPTPTTTPTPTPTTTLTQTPTPSGITNGDWISNEKAPQLKSTPFLQFTVNDGQIVSLTVSVFPIPSEFFWWYIESPLNIKENTFTCSTSSLPASSGQGEFILEGKFTADNQCEGTMKFPKGFFWVDFTLDHDVTFTWTAHPK